MRRSTLAWAGLVLLILGGGAALANAPALLNTLGQEEVQWINGEDFGYPDRLLQIWLFTRVLPLLAGSLLFPYLLPIIGHHIINALLVYALFSAFFCRTLGVAQARMGALLAGSIFATSRVALGTLGYISALAYTQVTTFCLLAALAAVYYSRRPSALLWAVVVLSVEAALLSHSFGLALPGFILLLEGALTRFRPWSRSWPWFAARYGVLFLLVALHVGAMWSFYHTSGIRGTVGHGGLADLLRESLRYLLDLAFVLLPGAGHDPARRRALLPLFAVLLAALVAAAVAVIWARPDRRPGLIEAVLLFGLAWCGMSLLPLLHFYWGRTDNMLYLPDHRMYLNTAGLSLLAAAVMCWRPAGLSILPRKYRVWASASITAAALAAGLLLTVDRPLHWARLLAAGLPGHMVQDACGSVSGHPGGRRMAARKMQSANFTAARLPWACAAFSDLSSARFGEAMLEGASFQQALMFGAVLRGAHARHANFYGANLTSSDLSQGDFTGASFQETCLRDARLAGAVLMKATLRAADLRGADLRRANLAGADLRDADLRSADLRDADLRSADLRHADLRSADLRGADLRGADLRGANLERAHLRDANLEGARTGAASPEGPQVP